MTTKGKVLIVDHRKKELDVLKKALEKKNFAVVTAESTKEGMKKADKECPDIIVLEAKMQQGGNALEICRNYRKDDSKFRHVPILMMIDRADYVANSLFENPRWSPFEALDNKTQSMKEIITGVEKTLNNTLEDTFVILFGYYKDEANEAAMKMMQDERLAKKTA